MGSRAISKVSDLVGIKYSEADCWKLVQMFYALEFKVELLNYQGDAPKERWEQKSLICSHRGDFVKTEKPKYGDVILINLYGLDCHLGIFMGDGLMLHTTNTTGSVIDRLGRWRKLISGFYTLEKTND